MRMQWWVFVIAWLVWCPWGQLKAEPVVVEKVKVREKLDFVLFVLQLKVKAPLEKVEMAIVFGEDKTFHYILPVKDGQVRWNTTFSRRLAPGRYELRFFRHKGGELAKYSFIYGTPEEVNRTAEELLEHTRELYQTLCEAVRRIYEGGAFFWNSILFLERKHPDVLQSYRRSIWRNWQNYYQFCKQLLRLNRKNLTEFRQSLFLHPHAKKLKALQELQGDSHTLLRQFMKWFRRWHLEFETSFYYMRSEKPRWQTFIEQLQEKVIRLGKEQLKLSTVPNLTASILTPSFQGVIHKDFVRESRLFFEISFDPKVWQLEIHPILPSIRLQWRHRENRQITIALEVNRYPQAKSYRDLQLLTVMMAQERWPGFRKLTRRAFQLKNANGQWEGFEFTFITERSNVRGKWVFLNRVYQIFLSDKQTVYSLRFSAPKEVFEKYNPDFEKLIKALKVFGNL